MSSAQSSLWWKTILSLAISCALLVACVQRQAGTGRQVVANGGLEIQRSNSFNPLMVNQIAILPFEAGNVPGLDAAIVEDLNASLLSAFDSGTGIEVLNVSRAEETRAAIASVRKLALPNLVRARSLGEKLKAQGVLVGEIARYVDSDGSKMGANQFASVHFTLWLVEPRTKGILWTANYDRSDKPLSENILRAPEFFSHGGLANARQLMQTGLQQAARSLEELRNAAGTKQ